jgi:hypothetical protein
MPDSPLLTVSFPDRSEVFEFRRERQTMTFGRDERCDIVVPSAGDDLSRLAGAIWRAQDELWVRNLSYAHELHIEIPGAPAAEPLRTRREDDGDPGFARAVDADVAYLRAPGGCLLLIQQSRQLIAEADVGGGNRATLRVSPVPDDLRPVAAALCEPLLDGGRLPAAYSEIVRRLGGPTLRQVRNLIDRLCRLYENEVPVLAAKVAERRRREEDDLAVGATPVLRNGVWVFPVAARHSALTDERIRRRALALPDYYEVAHLLVRRRLITSGDVHALPAQDPGRPT